MKKIAIITGASSGMGRQCAIQVSDRFNSLDEIWVIARRLERLEELKKECTKPIRIISGDLTTKDTISTVQTYLREEKPDVRLLINASGYGKIGSIGKMNIYDEVGMIDINSRALTVLTHITLPYIRNGGHIINFASAAAFAPQPGFGIYAATKAYVLFYSIALKRELTPLNIKVCAVCPGPVKTEFFNIAEEYQQIPIYKKILMVKPEKVVAKALRDSMRGNTISVYGFQISVLRFFAKILPVDLIIKLFKVN